MDEYHSDEYVQEMYRQYLAEQSQDEADMEPHKRTGYAEQMMEMADLKRKEGRENG